VDQLNDYADNRLIDGCVYCGGLDETRDHVPSRVFLDPPFPTNLPVLPACQPCNGGFSRDEEYLACLIECAVAGSTDPDQLRRPRIAAVLRRSPALRSRIESAKRMIDARLAFDVESERVQNVVLKLARGHAAYELSTPFRKEPRSLHCWPITTMTAEARESWEASHVQEMLGEVGSRGLQRMLVTQLTLRSQTGETKSLGLLINDWVDVQEERYRYLAVDDQGEIRIKIVIGEYLACEVCWAS
jgi:hypothetical protein